MEVIWIDDSSVEIQTVINHVFKKLWEKNIRSQLFIIGNNPRYQASIDKQIETLNTIVVGQFIDYLIDTDLIYKETANEAYRLINLTKQDSIIPESDVAINKYDDFISIQKKLESSSDLNIADNDIKMLLNDSSTDDHVIMIDICLSDQDYESLCSGKDDVTVFSMYLYHATKEAGYKTYMYSTYTYPTDLIEIWLKNYKQHFHFDDKEHEKIYFFDRKGEDVFNNNNKNLIDYLI